MATSLNVQEMVDEVRSQLDEFNEASVTNEHIIQALNRAQKAAVRLTDRKLDSLFLNEVVISSNLMTMGSDNVRELEMPKDAFGRKIEKVEVRLANSPILFRVHPITFKERDPYVLSSQVARPYYYDIKHTKIRLYPNMSPGLDIIIHYTRTPDRLVIPQGQINLLDTVNNYVIVDALGPDLTTESDQRASYVNIVDYVTGDVKCSLQVAFIDPTNNQIKFKSSALTRSVVFGKSILTGLTTDVTTDDYVSIISGTCVSQMPDAYTDYYVQAAVVEMKRRLREATADDYAALKDIEDALKKIFAGREQVQRIRKANPRWQSPLGSTTRRFFA